MLTNLRGSDIELLRLFIVVAESGGFSAAQAHLNITQSTISLQMSKLESRLGYRLCERGRGGFKLTEKGKRVLAASREMVDALNTFLNEAQETGNKLLGDLRIGLADNIGGNPDAHIDKALAAFHQQAPDVNLHIVVADPYELERKVIADELHIAVSYSANKLSNLHYQPLFNENQIIYCGQQHPLYQQTPIDIETLSQASWVGALHELPELQAISKNLASSTADHVDAALQLVLSGHFISHLPEHYAAPLVAKQLLWALGDDDLQCAIPFYAITRNTKHKKAALAAFLDILLEVHHSK